MDILCIATLECAIADLYFTYPLVKDMTSVDLVTQRPLTMPVKYSSPFVPKIYPPEVNALVIVLLILTLPSCWLCHAIDIEVTRSAYRSLAAIYLRSYLIYLQEYDFQSKLSLGLQ